MHKVIQQLDGNATNAELESIDDVEDADLSPSLIVPEARVPCKEKRVFSCNFCDFWGETTWDVVLHTRKMHY